MNRYLLIDDDEVITMIHPAIIRRVDKDCHIDISKQSYEALDFLNKELAEGNNPPDFIFLDINMPMINGFQFLDKLSDQLIDFLKNSQVIMLSSSIDPRDIEKAKQYQIVKDFISKPLSIEYINTILNKESHK
ncbi:MAG: response regulator [Crocinitomicaceae bacterium]|nr:response regulator [Crocinitomicaceae bacterium]MDP4865021.1 response regulator [Crocinitomicaceae bacterium]MDP5012066.1 response regulator [Crocinitomicaceae bacterium]MDP5099305.1 response regulator [Crocinitomicaceae bacterium]